jgi:hypothetical protein
MPSDLGRWDLLRVPSTAHEGMDRAIRRAIAAIDPDTWVAIRYPRCAKAGLEFDMGRDHSKAICVFKNDLKGSDYHCEVWLAHQDEYQVGITAGHPFMEQLAQKTGIRQLRPQS